MAIPTKLQDLAPQWAHLFLDIERFLLHTICVPLQEKRFLVAFSGGADSTFLLAFLQCMKSRWNAQVAAAHLDHGIRSHSSLEAEQVEEFCLSRGIPLHLEAVDVPSYAGEEALSLEEAGRTLRYQFLSRVRKRIQADYVCTGHHADDLAEDVLMRLIRGTGWPGLSGMPGWDPQRLIIRPLLRTSRNSLQEALREFELPWIEDETNLEDSFLRNRIRHRLLPQVFEENPSFLKSIETLWQLGRIDEQYWTSLLSGFPEPEAGRLALHRKDLEDLPRAARLRLFKHVLDMLGPGQVLFETILRLDEAYLAKKTGTVFQFSGDKTVRVLRNELLFSRNP